LLKRGSKKGTVFMGDPVGGEAWDAKEKGGILLERVGKRKGAKKFPIQGAKKQTLLLRGLRRRGSEAMVTQLGEQK